MSHLAPLGIEKTMGVPTANELTSCGAVLPEVQDQPLCSEPSNHRHSVGEWRPKPRGGHGCLLTDVNAITQSLGVVGTLRVQPFPAWVPAAPLVAMPCFSFRKPLPQPCEPGATSSLGLVKDLKLSQDSDPGALTRTAARLGLWFWLLGISQYFPGCPSTALRQNWFLLSVIKEP